MVLATENWPEQVISNPYENPMLVKVTNKLSQIVKDIYANFERTQVVKKPSTQEKILPPPLTQEEKKDLKRKPEEKRIDHIMRLLSSR